MTEDDTFNRLRRPSKQEILLLVEAWIHDYDDARTVAEFLEDHHWPLEEYNVINHD